MCLSLYLPPKRHMRIQRQRYYNWIQELLFSLLSSDPDCKVTCILWASSKCLHYKWFLFFLNTEVNAVSKWVTILSKYNNDEHMPIIILISPIQCRCIYKTGAVKVHQPLPNSICLFNKINIQWSLLICSTLHLKMHKWKLELLVGFNNYK